MKKIWVIEQGEYSDYHVVGVFSKKEYAERIAMEINKGESWSPATVNEWVLDPGIKDLNAGRKLYRILMDASGETEKVEEVAISGYCLQGRLNIWERTSAPAYAGREINDAVNGEIWATSPQHAIKSANEFRAQAIAEGRMRMWDEGRLKRPTKE